MSKAKEQKRDDSNDIAEGAGAHLDELILGDDGGKHLRALACSHVSKFLDSVPRDSQLALAICRMVEPNKIGLPELADQFPAGKKTFHDALESEKERKKPILDLMKKLTEEKKRLQEEKGGDTDHKERLSQIKQELKQIEKDLAEFTEIKYTPRYPDDSKGVGSVSANTVDEQDWKILCDWFKDNSKELADAQPGHIFKNLEMISKELGLTEAQVNVLTLLVVHEHIGFFDSIFDGFHLKNQKQYNALTAKMLGVKTEEVSELFRSDSPLVQYGLIDISRDPDVPSTSGYLDALLSEPDVTVDGLKKRLMGHSITTELDWEKDFKGLGEDGTRMVRLIESTIAKRQTDPKAEGHAFFLAGPPDTGKTSAVAALAQHLKKTHPELELRVIGENPAELVRGNHDDEGDYYEERKVSETAALTPHDRLAQIKMALALGGSNPNMIFLIEEPDRLMPRNKLTDETDESIDRVVIQRLIEKHGSTALIFTTNNWWEIHPAARRRVKQCIEFDVPDAAARRGILDRLCETNNVALAEADRDRLASTYEIPAGKWASAVKNAAVTAQGPDDIAPEIEYWIKNQAKRDLGSVNAVTTKRVKPLQPYDFQLLNPVNPSIPLDKLFDRVKKLPAGNQSFRMCLEGWPGTGKSEFVWHLADMMGKEVIHAKASEILDKYVGGTEQNIARFFEEAQEKGAILLIDEVDSILRDRREAKQSWEVSQVNQFLTSLEHYKGMVAVTTNNFEGIDAASKRRFDFTMGFDFLTQEQNTHAFKKFFGMDMPQDFTAPANMTPADYARVYKQAAFMGELENTDFITSQLTAASKEKPKEDMPRLAPPRRMGFGGHVEAVAKRASVALVDQ